MRRLLPSLRCTSSRLEPDVPLLGQLLTPVPGFDTREAGHGRQGPCCRGSGVDDDGDDEGPAAVGAKCPVRHGAGDELFELDRVPDTFVGGGS